VNVQKKVSSLFFPGAVCLGEQFLFTPSAAQSFDELNGGNQSLTGKLCVRALGRKREGARLPLAGGTMNAPRATLIGTFILGALALLVAGVLFFGGSALRNKHVAIVSFFDASVAGLRVGAPVTFRGVPIGEVKSIGVRVNPSTGQSIIQVNMELVPQALSVYGAPLPRDEALVPSLVHDGLTAQLKMQSLVTGLLSVELAFRPGEQVSRFGDATLPEVPSVPGHFEALTKQLETIDIEALRQQRAVLQEEDIENEVVEIILRIDERRAHDPHQTPLHDRAHHQRRHVERIDARHAEDEEFAPAKLPPLERREVLVGEDDPAQ
jgi:hypothetical protein